MKTSWISILKIALPTLVVGILLGWLIFGGATSSKPEEHDHNIMEETIWTCSMHPQVRQHESGQCPICGMDLIPLVSDGETLNSMAVSMSPTAMKLAHVATAVVGKMDPVKMVRLNGKVQADERKIFTQSSHLPGRIERLMISFTGEFVSQGQIIAYLYSPEIMTAQEELFEAVKIKDSQPQLFNAAKEKLKNWKLSENQINKIIQTGKAQEEFPVRADVSGYVTNKMVNLGDYINRGQGMYQIANLSTVWILFDVYETDMPWVKKGDKVEYTIQSFPGETFESKITFIDPVIDEKTRVAKARVEVTNTEQKLKPEMFVSGRVEAGLSEKNDALVIPKSAVMWTGTRSVVYVKSESESRISFSMREVTLGSALGDSYVIKDGLEDGEEIAVSGAFSIDAAAQLAGKPSMMNPEGGPDMIGHQHGKTEGVAGSMKQTNTINHEARKSLQPVYNAYLSLKDALVADEIKKAQSEGSKMLKAIGQVNMSLFTGESHTVWMEQSTKIERVLSKVQNNKTIEEVRANFQQVSDDMIILTQSLNPYMNTLYIQHCPMANNNKGADWLSLEEEIRNPYFGEAMLGCGEIKSIIK